MSAKKAALVLTALYALYKAFRVATSNSDQETTNVRVPHNAFMDKVIWITGASSGMGEALAYRLNRLGATLVLTARNKESLQRVADKCEVETGRVCMVLPASLDQLEEHEGLVASVISRHGRLDGLVLNHGIGMNCPLEDINLADADKVFKVNVLSKVSLTKHAAPHLRKGRCTRNGKALLAVTSSSSGIHQSPLTGVYGSSKHAVQGFFKNIRIELAASVDTVTMVVGPVKSGFSDRRVQGAGSVEGKYKNVLTTDQAVEQMVKAMYGGVQQPWIAPKPYLFYLYLVRYLPDVWEYFLKGSLGTRYMNRSLADYKSANEDRN